MLPSRTLWPQAAQAPAVRRSSCAITCFFYFSCTNFPRLSNLKSLGCRRFNRQQSTISNRPDTRQSEISTEFRETFFTEYRFKKIVRFLMSRRVKLCVNLNVCFEVVRVLVCLLAWVNLTVPPRKLKVR